MATGPSQGSAWIRLVPLLVTALLLALLVALARLAPAAGQDDPSPRNGSSTVPAPSAPTPDELIPEPSGPHAVGRTSLHWTDARAELETAAEDDRREVVVHLFYPADPGSTAPRAVYVPDADLMAGAFPADVVARVSALRSHALQDAAMLEGSGRHPVVLFLPGGGLKVLTYQALLEDLASHGWVVAAIDPPFNARAMRLPDGRVIRRPAGAESGWPEPRDAEEELSVYRERVEHWARDVPVVLDRLLTLDGGDGPFGGRLDLDRGVAVMGHSRGGQAAGTARLLDARVRGAVNVDGVTGEWPFQPLAGAEDDVGVQPLLWIQTPIGPAPTDEQLAGAGYTRAEYDAAVARILDGWARRLGAIEGGAMRVTFAHPGISHIDFSDEPFWDGLVPAAQRAGKVRTIGETRSWLRAFAEGSVLGDWSSLSDLAADAGAASDQAVSVEAFGPLRP